MKRYEGALRRLSILFILINLLSPLSAATTWSEEVPDPNAIPEETVVEEPTDPVVIEEPAQAPPVDEPAAPPSSAEQPVLPAADQQPAPPPPAEEPASVPQQSVEPALGEEQQPAEPVVPAERPKGGLKIVLLDENGNLLPGGMFVVYDVDGTEHSVTDGGSGDMDYAHDGVMTLTDILAGQVTVYQRGTADWYTFNADTVVLHSDGSLVIVYENVADTRLEVRNLPLDSDSDGVANRGNNCPDAANGTQVDTDRDLVGNACDPTPNGDTPTEAPALTNVMPADLEDTAETLAVCAEDGTLSAPSLTLPVTEGVTYTIDPVATEVAPYAPGQVVTIVASLNDATTSRWDPAFTSDAWKLNPDTNTYSHSFTFSDVPCEKPEAKLSLTKTVVALNGETLDADFTGLKAGDVLTYDIMVTNDGAVDLTNVTVTDELKGVVFDASGGNVGNLAAKASATVTVTYTVTDEDVTNGSITNTASAKGTAGDREVLSDPASITVPQGPAMRSMDLGVLAITDGISLDEFYAYQPGTTNQVQSLTPGGSVRCGTVVRYFADFTGVADDEELTFVFETETAGAGTVGYSGVNNDPPTLNTTDPDAYVEWIDNDTVYVRDLDAGQKATLEFTSTIVCTGTPSGPTYR